MIRELAAIRVRKGHNEAFEKAVDRAVPIFQRAEGALGFSLLRIVEDPQEYVLSVGWASVEDHTEKFRGSAAFEEWRALVSEHFDGVPRVTHVAHVATGF